MHFYSTSTLLAVLARPFLSVSSSVTLLCFIQTNEDAIMQFSASGRTIPLVSGEVKLSGYSQGLTLSEGVKVRHSTVV